jgi:hypothetical protein
VGQDILVGIAPATSWIVLGLNPDGGEIFRTLRDLPWGQPGLLFTSAWFFPGVKRTEHGVDHPPHLALKTFTSTLLNILTEINKDVKNGLPAFLSTDQSLFAKTRDSLNVLIFGWPCIIV